MPVVSNKHWNETYCVYDELNEEEKHHYMLGAQAEDYMNKVLARAKKLLTDLEMIMEAKDEINSKEAWHITFVKLAKNERYHRVKLNRLVRTYLRCDHTIFKVMQGVVMFPHHVGANGGSVSLVASLSQGKRNGVLVLAAHIQSRLSTFKEICHFIESNRYPDTKGGTSIDVAVLYQFLYERIIPQLETYNMEFIADTGSF